MANLSSPWMSQDNPDSLRVPPHSIDAEQAVLGGLMLDGEAFEAVSERLSADDFYRHDHRQIFRAIADLASRQSPIDLLTASALLGQENDKNANEYIAYLGELAKNTPSAANITAYADIVRERSLLRRLAAVGTDVAEQAFEPKGRLASDLVDEAERKIFEIAQRGQRGPGPRLVSQVLVGTMEHIQKLFESQEPLTGLPTGFTDVDKITSGLQPGDMVIVAGRPSMGKTTFALNIAEYAAIQTKRPVLVFSMEMPSEQLAMRMISSLGRIDQHHLRTGHLTDADWPRIANAVGLLSSAPFYIDDSSGLSPQEVRTRARRLVKEKGDIGLVVIDYLQLMRSPGHHDNRVGEISEISRSLKALAKELSCPVIALSQLNRSLEQRPNKRPVMADLRESGAIEQDADLIAFIYRDEVYHEDSKDKGTAEILIAKHRNGPTGMARLAFAGQFTRFDNFANSTFTSLE